MYCTRISNRLASRAFSPSMLFSSLYHLPPHPTKSQRKLPVFEETQTQMRVPCLELRGFFRIFEPQPAVQYANTCEVGFRSTWTLSRSYRSAMLNCTKNKWRTARNEVKTTAVHAVDMCCSGKEVSFWGKGGRREGNANLRQSTKGHHRNARSLIQIAREGRQKKFWSTCQSKFGQASFLSSIREVHVRFSFFR